MRRSCSDSKNRAPKEPIRTISLSLPDLIGEQKSLWAAMRRGPDPATVTRSSGDGGRILTTGNRPLTSRKDSAAELAQSTGEPTAASGTHGNGRSTSRDLRRTGFDSSSSTLGDSWNSAVSLVEIDRVLRAPMSFSIRGASSARDAADSRTDVNRSPLRNRTSANRQAPNCRATVRTSTNGKSR